MLWLRIGFGVGLSLSCVLLSACAPLAEEKPARDGVLDLRAHDWTRSGAVALTGAWQFEWKQLSNPLAVGETKGPLLQVPGSWNSFVAGGSPVGGRGFATYRLSVRLPRNSPPLALRVKHFDSAVRLFVNGRIIHEAGVVGTREATSKAGRVLTVSELRPTDELRIVAHVSNFQHSNGGFPRALVLGEKTVIEAARLQAILTDTFLFGALLIIGLYHLGLFALRRKDRSALLFALFCLLIALRTAVVGERLTQHIGAVLPFSVEHRIEYLTFYLATPVFLAYAALIFPGSFKPVVTQAVLLVSLIASAFVLGAPSYYYSKSNPAMQVMTVAVGAYILGAVLFAAHRQRSHARTFLLGFAVLFAAALNDILYTRHLVRTGFVVPFGLFLFVLAQAFLLSRKLLSAFQTAETLSVDLANSERRYRHLVEDSGEIIVSLDEEGRVQTANKAVRALLGVGPQAVVGHHLSGLLYERKGSNTFVGRQILEEHLSKVRKTRAEQQFYAEFRTATGEPCELSVRLQSVELAGEHAVFGNIARRSENLLAKYCRADRRTYEITSSFSLAEVLNQSVTSGLEGHLPESDVMMVRLALREVLANAIEHGNLNISFEEKTEATESGRMIQLIAERLQDPKYQGRTVRVSVELTSEEAVFNVADQGGGFDHAAMVKRALALEHDPGALFHGRGIAYALNFFDSVSYNEAGNEVRLVKKLTPMQA